MSLPVIVRPDAEADIRTIHADLEQARSGFGQRFAGQVRRILERIELLPEAYAPVWQDVRAVRVKKFRQVVYYVVLADRVEILAVMHGSRDPSAWQSRA